MTAGPCSTHSSRHSAMVLHGWASGHHSQWCYALEVAWGLCTCSRHITHAQHVGSSRWCVITLQAVGFDAAVTRLVGCLISSAQC